MKELSMSISAFIKSFTRNNTTVPESDTEPTTERTRKPKTISYFLIFSWIGISAVVIGFAKTYTIPVSKGIFKAPAIIHVHGNFAFAWVLLFMIQASLIHFHRYKIHRRIGIIGLLIAMGVAITMIPAGIFAVEKELSRGTGDVAYSTLPGVITSGLVFLTLVVLGIMFRDRPDYHKRFMLLATIVVLWPAWFRFRHYFPSIPRPDIWFAVVLADSLIIIAWIIERIRYGKIHPLLKYAGAFIILEHCFEVIAFDSMAWQATGRWLYDFFSV